MAWSALTFTVPGIAADDWADALLAAGALAVDVTDAAAGTPDEIPQFGEPHEFFPGVWQTNRLTVLLEADIDVPAVLAAIARNHGWQVPVGYTMSAVEEQDWVRLTQAQFAPIQISTRLWIVPSWHAAPDPTAINVVVDPGLAFGTGSHPTTRLCLRWLDENLKPGQTVLDYGCGSGILGIAAKRLGAAAVTGTDLDPQALLSSRQNAVFNGTDCEFVDPCQLGERAFDIVVANILTNPLRMLAAALARRVRAGGRIVLSGILAEQARDIIAAYQPWFNIDVWEIDEGWAAITGVRHHDGGCSAN